MKTVEEVLQTVKDQAAERYSEAYRAWLEKLATLSLTALTLLVALQSSYVPQNPQAGWLLSGCWSLLAVAILAALLALFGEARAHRLFLLRVRAVALDNIAARGAMGQPLPDAREMIGMIQRIDYSRPKLYQAAAAIAALSLAFALAALAAFAILNLP